MARALVNAPSLILADEPTGNLDTHSSYEVMGLFDRLNAVGRTIVVITHEEDIAEHAKRFIRLVDGRIVEDRRLSPVDGRPPKLGAAEVSRYPRGRRVDGAGSVAPNVSGRRRVAAATATCREADPTCGYRRSSASPSAACAPTSCAPA